MWWLERARPDVLLMQETKLADADAPAGAFRDAGYELAHHGEGRWNGVAIASRCGVDDVVTNFGQPLGPARTPDAGDDEPLAEARMIAARCGGIRVVSLYAPNGRAVGSPFYDAKLAWFDRLHPLARRGGGSGRASRAGRRLQRRTRRHRRLGSARAATAEPTFLQPSVRRSPGCAAGDWSTRIACAIPSPAATPGGTTAQATSTRTSACASIICWPHDPSPSVRSGRRSTARRARASRFPPTMRRS